MLEKITGSIGMAAAVIGLAGIPGAIDTGTSPWPAVALLAVGVLLLVMYGRESGEWNRGKRK